MTTILLKKKEEIDNHNVARELQSKGEKVLCPTCQRNVIVKKNGECPICKLVLVGDDEVPF